MHSNNKIIIIGTKLSLITAEYIIYFLIFQWIFNAGSLNDVDTCFNGSDTSTIKINH